VVEALPNVEVPAVSVENMPVVNVGLGDSAIVLVPEKRTLDPAVKNDTGLL
jgi:autonomous glycyl radical cofactor GrcA